MAFLTAGFVDGSRVHAEILRRAVYAATGGGTGVVTPSDLRVSAMPTPGAGVIVGAGAALVQSGFANAGAQTYVVANDQAITLPIPSNTGSGAVTWHVCVVVRDPQYAGQVVPADPLTDPYTDLVAVRTLPTGAPYLALAKVTVPGNTSAVAQAMITPTAGLAAPRSSSRTWMLFPDSDKNASKSQYGSWPLSDFAVDVPTWATKMQVTATVSGAEYVAASGTDKGVLGLRLIFHGASTLTTQNGIAVQTGPGRQTIAVGGEFGIAAADRGTTRYVGLQAYQTAGSGSWQQDYQSQVVIQVTFTEVV